MGYEQAALQRLFAGIVAFKQRMKVGIPVAHEIESALLHPSLEVFTENRIRGIEDWILGIEHLNRGFLDGHASIGLSGWIWSVMSRVERTDTLVVLHKQRAAARNEVQQPRVVRSHICSHVVRPNSQNDRIEPAQIRMLEIGRRNHLNTDSKLAQY